jgi:UDP-N-acetyl-D-glucosamine dehydrogenase
VNPRPTDGLVVVGQGYVGLALAMRAAAVGYRVVGLDTDAHHVKRLADGDAPYGDVTDSELRSALRDERYRVTNEPGHCAGFDVAVIAVPTPLRDGAPDLSHIEDAGRMLAPFLRPGATVVLESTTYPGTTEELLVPILESGSGLTAGSDFHVGYSPERIDPGNPTWRLANTPKVVAGIDAASSRSVADFYASLVEDVVIVSGPKEAELAKLLENTFRHVNVALVNELAVFAHDLGIDMWEAIDAATTKPFGYMRFEPGPGVGGHCLPIDPSYLSWRVRRELGQPFRFVELANDVNDRMPDYVVRRLMVALNERGRAIRGSRVLLLGLAYKPNTGDARESPAVRVARLLIDLGADVRAVDPHVSDSAIDLPLTRAALQVDEVAAADAVLLLTDHDVFDYHLVADESRYVLDTRHRLSGANVDYL